jgi:hypothetical protein
MAPEQCLMAWIPMGCLGYGLPFASNCRLLADSSSGAGSHWAGGMSACSWLSGLRRRLLQQAGLFIIVSPAGP